MKKFLSVTVVIFLAVMMTVSAAALLSPVNNGSIINKMEAVDANNNPITPVIGEVDKEIANQATSIDTIKSVLGNTYQEGMTVLSVISVTVPEGTTFPVTINIYVSGLTADTTGAVMHYNEQTASWEKIEGVFHDGYVAATFNSLSPVAIVVDGKTTTAIEKIFSDNTSGTPQSPQTLDFTSAAIFCAVSSVVLGGIALNYKSKKKNNF